MGQLIHGVTPAAAHQPFAHCDFTQEVDLSCSSNISEDLDQSPALPAASWGLLARLSFLICKMGLVIPTSGGLRKSTCSN